MQESFWIGPIVASCFVGYIGMAKNSFTVEEIGEQLHHIAVVLTMMITLPEISLHIVLGMVFNWSHRLLLLFQAKQCTLIV